MEGLHLFQLDSGCAGGKKGDRALSEKSSSPSKVQAEAALKWGGEDTVMKMDTWRGPSRNPAERGITAGPGCNSAESFVPAKMFLGNKLFSTAREGERTQGRGSGDGVRGRERERTRVLAVYFPYGASKVHLFLSRFVLFTLQAL